MRTIVAVAIFNLFIFSDLMADPNVVPLQTVSPEKFHREALENFSMERISKRKASLDQLKAWMEKRDVILIDLRDEAEYKKSHIKGAINIPVAKLEPDNVSKYIPSKESRVVVYCQQNFSMSRMLPLTTLGYPIIIQLGYNNVYMLEEFWSKQECDNVLHPIDNSKPSCPLEIVKGE